MAVLKNISVNGKFESITRPIRHDRNIVFEGNSRTTDWFSRNVASGGLAASESTPAVSVFQNRGFYSYPHYLMQLPNFKNRFNYFNFAIWGNANMQASSWWAAVLSDRKYNLDIYPQRPETHGGSSGIKEAWLFIQTGLIDIWNSTPATVGALITAKRNYLLTAKSHGFKVVVLGEYFGYNPSFRVPNNNTTGVCQWNDSVNNVELARHIYNNAMMAMAAKGEIDMYIDLDHLFTPNLREDSKDPYHFDTIAHLTGAGHQLIAEYVNSLFSAAGTSRHVVYNRFINFAEFHKKVDKVAGKQLSTNDYTTAEKNKLADMPVKQTQINVPLSLTISSIAVVENEGNQWIVDLYSSNINLAHFEDQTIDVKRGGVFYFSSYAASFSGGVQVECFDQATFNNFINAQGAVTIEKIMPEIYVEPTFITQKLNLARASGKLIPQYANNNAALLGGLQPGEIYRTGADLKIVLPA